MRIPARWSFLITPTSLRELQKTSASFTAELTPESCFGRVPISGSPIIPNIINTKDIDTEKRLFAYQAITQMYGAVRSSCQRFVVGDDDEGLPQVAPKVEEEAVQLLFILRIKTA